MKQIILAVAFLMLISGRASAATNLLPDSIVRIFEKQFPDASGYQSYASGRFYYFTFSPNERIQATVIYNRAGELLQVTRYYPASELDPFIRQKVYARHPGGHIESVIELLTKGRRIYDFIISSDHNWTSVTYDPSVGFYHERKYKK